MLWWDHRLSSATIYCITISHWLTHILTICMLFPICVLYIAKQLQRRRQNRTPNWVNESIFHSADGHWNPPFSLALRAISIKWDCKHTFHNYQLIKSLHPITSMICVKKKLSFKLNNRYFLSQCHHSRSHAHATETTTTRSSNDCNQHSRSPNVPQSMHLSEAVSKYVPDATAVLKVETITFSFSHALSSTTSNTITLIRCNLFANYHAITRHSVCVCCHQHGNMR